MFLQRDMRRMCWLGESSGAIKSASDLRVSCCGFFRKAHSNVLERIVYAEWMSVLSLRRTEISSTRLRQGDSAGICTFVCAFSR